MRATYTTKTGKEIQCFLWDDVLEGKYLRETIEIYGKDKNISVPLTMDPATGELYFVYDNEAFYCKDFDAMSLNTLISKLAEGSECNDVTEAMMLATFMKEWDHIGFVANLPLIDLIIPTLGVALSSNKTVATICFPEVDGEYPIYQWSYKMKLIPCDENMQKLAGRERYYMSDLYSMVKTHIVKVVDLNNVNYHMVKATCVSERKAKPEQIHKGQTYYLDFSTLYEDSDKDVYVKVYDNYDRAQAKEIGNMCYSHFKIGENRM